MQQVLKALWRSSSSLFRKGVFVHFLWPGLLSLLLWIVVAAFFWSQINGWLVSMITSWSFLPSSWLSEDYSRGVLGFISQVVMLMLLFSLIYVTTALLVATIAVPLMLEKVAKHEYRDLEMRRGGSQLGSITNAAVAGIVFILLLLVSLPFWLVPGIGFFAPLIFTALLNRRAFSYDSLMMHADRSELKVVRHKYKGEMLVLGLFGGLLAYIPIVNFFAPAFCGLSFVHFTLATLRNERQGKEWTVIDKPAYSFLRLNNIVVTFSALIIGDEILSGRRQDKHLVELIRILGRHGLRLSRASYIGDERQEITRVLRDSLQSDGAVFCFGGIGATPDDHTRQAAADAVNEALQLHPEAEAFIRQRFGSEVTPQRLEMGVFPTNAKIIPNPYNQIPGFSINRHYFVPGFPAMAWPMVEWVLDQYYKSEVSGSDYVESAIQVSAYESELLDLMIRIENEYPEVKTFSLPTLERLVELGVKGPNSRVSAAMDNIKSSLDHLQLKWQEESAPG